ncbi:MAG: hypothetical protein LBT06_17170 [Hungatella sp.]|nr:hypothetical protein [Hungatella sp.]
MLMIPANADPALLSMLGAMSSVNQAIITKDPAGNYMVSFHMSEQSLTNGSYLQAMQTAMNVSNSNMGVKGKWELDGSRWRYYQNGYVKNQWVMDKNCWYYLDSAGYMVLGWKTVGGKTYYLKSKKSKGQETGGYMVTGWQKIDEKWYYFRSSGEMLKKDWRAGEDGKWYYCGVDGKMVTSKIIDWKGKKYFVDEDGAMAVNRAITDPETGKTYEADENGVLNEVAGNGREYTFPDTIKGKLNGVDKKLYPNVKWFSYQCTTTGTAKDANGRYKIVVGPKILDSNYPDGGRLWTEDFGVKSLNVRIDVVLKNELSGNTKTIECVAVGLKAHTYNIHPDKTKGHKHKIFNYNKNITASYEVENGLLQTGIAYPNCSNAQQDKEYDGPIAVDHMNGSPVEFYGSSIDFKANDYKLVKIIVLE